MKVFNDRQRKIGYPEVHFDTLDIELGAGAFTVAVRPQGAGAVDEAVAERVTAAHQSAQRRHLRRGRARGAALRAESWNAQRDAAWEAWATEHPEVFGRARHRRGGAERRRCRRTARPPEDPRRNFSPRTSSPELRKHRRASTDSEALPRPQREEEEEEDPFDFPVDYTLSPSSGPMAQHAPTIPSQRLSSASGIPMAPRTASANSPVSRNDASAAAPKRCVACTPS